MNKFQQLFERITERVETDPTPVHRYFFLYLALLATRLLLEFFSSNRLFTLDDVLHIGLWFTFIVQAFLLQLHLFSGQQISRIIRLVVTFFSIALTAPLLDICISGGKGVKMNYLSLNSWEQIGWSYITVGGSSFSNGATPGIRIEIVLLVLACFNYVRTQRQSWVWGVAAAWSVYTVLFISGALPLILGKLVAIFQLQYTIDDRSTLLLLINIDILLLFLIFYQYNKGLINILFKNMRLFPFAFACLYFIISALQARKLYPGNWSFNPTTLFWFPLLAALFIGGAALTALYRLSKKSIHTFRISNGLLLLMGIISLSISGKLLFIVVVFWAILFLKNEPPLQLRSAPVIRNLLDAAAFSATGLAGFICFGGPMVGYPNSWLFIPFVCCYVISFFEKTVFRKSDF